MTTNPTLKACPFCGSEPELSDLGDPKDDSFVFCPWCEVQQIANYTPEKAVERWNQRSIPDDEGTVERVMIALFQCEWGKSKTITTEYERKFWSKRARAAIKAIGGM